ncbi:MAG: hypothetical protein J6W43_07850 [Prevotella sp.]|nr:hypothetical protein [Prevotella sp.]
MKKSLFMGIALLSVGFAFMACSHDTVSNENYVEKKRGAEYQQAFNKAFGTIASGHKWGFDQTTGHKTRTAVTETNEYWIIPENCWGGSQNKEGWNANEILGWIIKDAEGNILPTLADFSFDNYFLQHVEKVKGKAGNSIKCMEAFNSNTGEWEAVTNFKKGDNPNGTFTVTAENTYFYAPINKSAHGTTLMTDMGGAAYNNENNSADPANGKLFRLLKTDGTYNYNYGFFRKTAYHKDLKKDIVNEPFLAFEIEGDYWVIRLGVGEKATEPDPVLAEGRVFCEDMGANDFDFNDVVFDAKIMRTGEINIKVLAHGGTLPIAIDGVLVPLGQMTNTGVNEDDIYEFTIDAVNGQPKYATIDAIPVTVNPNGGAENTYSLEAPIGSAPQKICAPVGTLWPKEYTKISDAYSPFTTWVSILDPANWTFEMDPEKVFMFQ